MAYYEQLGSCALFSCVALCVRMFKLTSGGLPGSLKSEKVISNLDYYSDCPLGLNKGHACAKTAFFLHQQDAWRLYHQEVHCTDPWLVVCLSVFKCSHMQMHWVVCGAIAVIDSPFTSQILTISFKTFLLQLFLDLWIP